MQQKSLSAEEIALDFAKFLEECTTVIYGDKIVLYRYDGVDGVGNYILDDIYTVWKDKYSCQKKEKEDVEKLAEGYSEKFKGWISLFKDESEFLEYCKWRKLSQNGEADVEKPKLFEIPFPEKKYRDGEEIKTWQDGYLAGYNAGTK